MTARLGHLSIVFTLIQSAAFGPAAAMTRVRPRCFDGPDDGPETHRQPTFESPATNSHKQDDAPKILTVLHLSLP